MTTIIDYGAGNTKSIINLLQRMNVPYNLSHDTDELLAADRLILPGVGHAATAMEALDKYGLIDFIKGNKKPFLGICLGMQLMYTHSDEGNTECLGILPGTVSKFSVQSGKVPHMGWNTLLSIDTNCPLFKNITEHSFMYFVHSYYASISSSTVAKCQYSIEFSASVQVDNFFGVQFHPEKSGVEGQKIIENFTNLGKLENDLTIQ